MELNIIVAITAEILKCAIFNSHHSKLFTDKCIEEIKVLKISGIFYSHQSPQWTFSTILSIHHIKVVFSN